MGKGGKSDGEEQNMAAWLVAINTLKIQPFNLPALGIFCFWYFNSFLAS